MRNVNVRLILSTVAIVALLCDFVACVNAENFKLGNASLRGIASQRELSWKSSKSSKSKSSKKSKHEKHSKKSKHDKKSKYDSSSSDSSDSKSGRSEPKERKEPPSDDDRSPEEDSDNIGARAIPATIKIDSDGEDDSSTTEQIDSFSEIISIASSGDETTESLSEDSTEGTTEELTESPSENTATTEMENVVEESDGDDSSTTEPIVFEVTESTAEIDGDDSSTSEPIVFEITESTAESDGDHSSTTEPIVFENTESTAESDGDSSLTSDENTASISENGGDSSSATEQIESPSDENTVSASENGVDSSSTTEQIESPSDETTDSDNSSTTEEITIESPTDETTDSDNTSTTEEISIESPTDETTDSDNTSTTEEASIESPSDETTETTSENPTEVSTEDTGATIENEDEGVRTVQILHPGSTDKCMTFDYTLDNKAMYMANCSQRTRRQGNHDYWDIVEIAAPEGEGSPFKLRHKSTQLCIPINPEAPASPFNCLQYFGRNEAIADSFNGLVDCNSDFAAVFETDTSSNTLIMSNIGCQEDAYTLDPVAVFMTYRRNTNGRNVAVWGGKVLLDLEGTEKYNINSEWIFVDVE